VRLSYAAWVAAIGRHYRAVLAASLLLSVLAALSLTRLRLDINVLNMLPRGTPAFDDFKSFVGAFGQLDELLLLVDGAPPAELRSFVDALAPRLLACDAIAEVHARIDTDRMLEGMLGTYLFHYIPEEAYGEVAARLTPEAIDAQVAVDRAILAAPFDLSAVRQVVADPLGFRRIAGQHLAGAYADLGPALEGGYFTARDGGALLVFVHPNGSAFDSVFTARLMEEVGRAVAETAGELDDHGVRVRYAGAYAFALEDASMFKRDIARYTVLSLLGVLAIFFVAYGNLRILPFVTYPLIVTTLVTFALSLFLYDELNALSLSFAAILYGLAIDSGIYFYTRLLEERRRRGGDIGAAVTATLAGLGRANVAATATSAGAFVVIGLSTLSTVRQLGVLTAIGMLATTVEFFTLYPALGFLLGSGARGDLRSAEPVRMARWAAAVRGRAWGIRLAVAAMAVVLAGEAFQVELDATLNKLRPADSAAMRVQDEIAARFMRESGSGSGAVVVHGDSVEEALERHEQVAALLRDYRARGLLRSVQSIDAVLPSARTQQARLARFNALPRAAAAASLRDSLERQGFKADRFRTFLDDFAQPKVETLQVGDPALAPLAFMIQHHLRTRGDGTIAAAYLEPADGVAWPDLARQLRADLGALPVAIAARPLLEFELGRVLRRELLLFLALAFLGNLAILMAVLRDVRTALAVITPDALVVLALFAGMAALGVAIDPVNLVIPPLIFGIGVDNGVYLAITLRQRGSIEAAIRSIGRAITVTSLTTIAGFGFLAFSGYPPLATMGRLMAIGLALSLAGTFFLLPALLPRRAAGL